MTNTSTHRYSPKKFFANVQEIITNFNPLISNEDAQSRTITDVISRKTRLS